MNVDVHSAFAASFKLIMQRLFAIWLAMMKLLCLSEYDLLHFDCCATWTENNQLFLKAWRWRWMLYSACAASLKLIIYYLLSGWLWWNNRVDQNTIFSTLAAVPPEQRIISYSSLHGNEIGCSLSLCCKFEINQRLFAIWLVEIKFTPIK